MRKPTIRLLAMAVVAAMLVTACTGGTTTTDAADGPADTTASSEAPGTTPATDAPVAEPAPAPAAAAPPPPPPLPAERVATLDRLLQSLDEVRIRGAEVSSAVALTTIVLAEYLARQGAEENEREWLDAACTAWTERLRMTRRDRETMGDMLRAMTLLQPMHRRGRDAKGLVGRPWFREALMLYTVWLHSRGEDLDQIGKWKVIAAANGQPHRHSEKHPTHSRPGGASFECSRAGHLHY